MPRAALAPPSGTAVVQLRLSQVPLAVMADGRQVALSGLDAALLAWLALEGPTHRDRLVQLLWPGSAPEAGRNTLRQRLFKLKRQWGVDPVQGQATVQLGPELAHDLLESEDVLGGWEPVGSEELQGWLGGQRELRRQRLALALAELADMAEQVHDWADALGHARELLALQPLSEEAHRRVMRLHYLAGDRAEALLAFDRCEQRLKDEVGTRPSAETLALLRTLEASAPASAPAVRPLGSAGAVTTRPPVAVLRPPRLIGRAAAWQSLTEARAQGQVAWVLGEGGLGKTRLATDFVRAQGPALVVGARPGDERVAHACMSRILRALPAERLRALPAATRCELARLLPELGEAPPLRSEAERSRFFNAVASVFLTAGDDASEAVLVEDLHFADEASLELLRYVVEACPRPWVLTARAAEMPALARRWLDALTDEGRARTVGLAPLGLAEVQELLTSLTLDEVDPAAWAPVLTQRSGGNPLILLELIKAGLAQGALQAGPSGWPVVEGLHRLVAGRLSRLSVLAVQLARCAAVASPDFSIELAAEVLGRRTIELADPWSELEQAQVLDGGALVHDLVHEAILASIPAVVARQLHAEVAGFLQRQSAAPARIAPHWAAAERWGAAAQAYTQAAQALRGVARIADQLDLWARAAAYAAKAEQADLRFDALLARAALLSEHQFETEAEAALSQLEPLAIDQDQLLRLLLLRSEHANQASDARAAERFARQGLEVARRLGREPLVLRFATVLAGALSDLREGPAALQILAEHQALADRQTDADLVWNYWHQRAFSLDYAGRLREAGPVWDRSWQQALSAGRPDLAWQSLANGASTLAKLGQVRRAAALQGQAHQLASDAHEATTRLQAMRNTWAHRLRDLGDYAQAIPLLEACLADFQARGAAFDAALAEHRLAQAFQQLGQPARAVALLKGEASAGPPWVAVMRAVHRADLAHDLGQDGLAAMRAAMALVPDHDDVYYRIASLFATRLVPPDEAEVLAASLAQWAESRERLGVALAGHVRAAGAAWRQGAAARAQPHVQAALRLAEEHQPDSFYLPELWWVAGEVAQALGRPDEALAHWQTGWRWVTQEAQAPEPFRASFLARNPVNRALQAALARGGR